MDCTKSRLNTVTGASLSDPNTDSKNGVANIYVRMYGTSIGVMAVNNNMIDNCKPFKFCVYSQCYMWWLMAHRERSKKMRERAHHLSEIPKQIKERSME